MKTVFILRHESEMSRTAYEDKEEFLFSHSSQEMMMLIAILISREVRKILCSFYSYLEAFHSV